MDAERWEAVYLQSCPDSGILHIYESQSCLELATSIILCMAIKMKALIARQHIADLFAIQNGIIHVYLDATLTAEGIQQDLRALFNCSCGMASSRHGSKEGSGSHRNTGRTRSHSCGSISRGKCHQLNSLFALTEIVDLLQTVWKPVLCHIQGLPEYCALLAGLQMASSEFWIMIACAEMRQMMPTPCKKARGGGSLVLMQHCLYCSAWPSNRRIAVAGRSDCHPSNCTQLPLQYTTSLTLAIELEQAYAHDPFFCRACSSTCRTDVQFNQHCVCESQSWMHMKFRPGKKALLYIWFLYLQCHLKSSFIHCDTNILEDKYVRGLISCKTYYKTEPSYLCKARSSLSTKGKGKLEAELLSYILVGVIDGHHLRTSYSIWSSAESCHLPDIPVKQTTRDITLCEMSVAARRSTWQKRITMELLIETFRHRCVRAHGHNEANQTHLMGGLLPNKGRCPSKMQRILKLWSSSSVALEPLSLKPRSRNLVASSLRHSKACKQQSFRVWTVEPQ